MDFCLNEDQKTLVDAARNFAEKELAPNAAEWDQTAFFPVDVIKRAGQLGYCSIYCREEQGGLGLGRVEASLIFEELSKGCTSTTAYLTIHNMATWMVTEFGGEELQQEYADALTQGQLLASYCLTEPSSGSDAASLRTTAIKQNENYIVTGSKAFISGAGSTDVLVVMVRTGESGARGISCLFIPTNLPGISFGRKEPKMGWNSQPTRAIHFDQVKVPAKYLIGEEGQGFTFAMKGLDGGRLNIASCSLGTAQAALIQAHRYLNERQQFGKPLAAYQALQFKLADMATELVAARCMVRLAASMLDQKNPDATTYCAMAKRFATDVGFTVCNEALQLHGGYGYIQEYPLERYVRDVRVHQILEGTNEIMRLIVSRKLLGDMDLIDRLQLTG